MVIKSIRLRSACVGSVSLKYVGVFLLFAISCSSEGNKSQDELIEEAYPYVTNTGISFDIEDFKDKVLLANNKECKILEHV